MDPYLPIILSSWYIAQIIKEDESNIDAPLSNLVSQRKAQEDGYPDKHAGLVRHFKIWVHCKDLTTDMVLTCAVMSPSSSANGKNNSPPPSGLLRKMCSDAYLVSKKMIYQKALCIFHL